MYVGPLLADNNLDVGEVYRTGSTFGLHAGVEEFIVGSGFGFAARYLPPPAAYSVTRLAWSSMYSVLASQPPQAAMRMVMALLC